MSQVKISGDVSGTGTLTVAAPNTNSNFTLTLPATTAPILAGSGITLSASAPANTLVTDASGNVGIGTSSPGSKLTVVAASGTASTIQQTSATGYGLTIIPGADTTFDAFAINNAANTVNNIKMFGNGSATFAGNVGIGTSSPVTKLHVAGTFTITGAGQAMDNSQAINMKNTSGTLRQAMVVDGSNNLGLGGTVDGGILFYTSLGNERMRIDSSGNLLVGTTNTTPSSSNVVGFSVNSTGFISLTGNATSAIDCNRTNNGIVQAFRRGGTLVGDVAVTTTTTTYNSSSDYRLKTVIGPVANAGQRIDALQPVEYTWNANGERTRGFLAHQFAEVYAGSVSGTKDAVDAEGKPVYQAMQASTSEVIADLVAEIKSLRQRLSALEQT